MWNFKKLKNNCKKPKFELKDKTFGQILTSQTKFWLKKPKFWLWNFKKLKNNCKKPKFELKNKTLGQILTSQTKFWLKKTEILKIFD